VLAGLANPDHCSLICSSLLGEAKVDSERCA
jgi:hypothetical protein